MSEDPDRTAAKVQTRERVEADEAIGAHEAVLAPVASSFLPAELRARIDGLRTDDRDEARLELAEAEDSVRVREQQFRAISVEFRRAFATLRLVRV